MLPKQYRLSRTNFNLVYKHGRRFRGKTFGLIVLASKDKSEDSKIGIVVSSKVFKKAADRNKLKRQIRGILVNMLSSLPLGQKIVLTALLAPKTRKFKETKDELASLLDSLKS